jgi:hypothetical protein
LAALSSLAAAEAVFSLAGPDGRLQVGLRLTPQGEPRYSVQLGGRRVLDESRLGIVRQDADFTRALELVDVTPLESVHDEYELLTSKKRLNRYAANRRAARLQLPDGQRMSIEFQVSNDGVAFRYVFPEENPEIHRIRSEASSFRFPAGTRAWLQPMAVAKSGWSSTNPSYEELYLQDVEVGTRSPTGAGWVYPALFQSGDTWLLVSETGLTRNYCGTRLESTWRSPEYTVGFPDPLEHFQDGAVAPESRLPWTTPWRIVVIGDLETIVESTLGTDLAAEPAASTLPPGIDPGRASWSWPLLGDDDTDFDTQKRFIDYAAEMGWEYTLVDALWDRQIGYDGLRELVRYAHGKDVRILVWYNSAGDWNSTFQTPRDRMLTRESRLAEFERLDDIGVAGLKVDFFGGDGQSVMHYYQDILEDAARFGFVMNFHGSTLPRGWQRTYPNLMTMEAVRGLEFVTFEQKNAEDEATHAAMLPFTRNVFDPMDFTPVVLDRIHNIERRTTSAFELALSVLFTSGIQHYAEIPEGMAKAPGYVREFLKNVPSVWDDVEFIDGFPGRYVVLARRAGDRWYLAGINAESEASEVVVDLREFDASGGFVITDGDGANLSFRRASLQTDADGRATIPMRPSGGFVAVLEPETAP